MSLWQVLRGRPLVLVVLASAIYSAVFTHLSFANHFSFRTLAADLGIFNQALYSSLNFGLLFYDTVELGSHFQFHFDPALFLLLPLYSFVQSPLLLLAVQSAALGLAAIPAFLFSRDVLESDALALILATCYLANPSIHGVNLYDFHPDCFFPLLFFLSLLFMRRGRLLKSAFCMVLALMCKEVAALAVAAMGLYVAWAYRGEIRWRLIAALKLREALSSRPLAFAALTVALGVGWFILSSALFPSLVSADRHAFSWSYLGVGMGSVIKSFLVNPVGSLQAAFTPTPMKFILLKLLYGKYLPDQVLLAITLMEPSLKVTYLFELFFPFAFLPLLSPAVLLPAAPWLLVSVTSITPTHYVAVGYQYPSLVVPFIFAASVHGMKNLAGIVQKVAPLVNLPPRLAKVAYSRSKVLLCLALIVVSCSFACFYAWSPTWLVGEATPRDHVLQAVVSVTPPHLKVATQNNLFPHFTPTMQLYLGHYTFMPADFYDVVVVDTYSPWYALSGSSGLRLLYDLRAPSELVDELLSSGKYEVAFQFDGILVLVKRCVT